MNDYIQYDPQSGYVMLYCANSWFRYKATEKPIGQGGMGDVLRGVEITPSGLGRRVAIKRVHDRYAEIPEIRHRARVEAGFAFRHPHLVEMIGCCESVTGRGPVYIISNFVFGQTIDSFIKDMLQGLDREVLEKRIISMMLPVLDALEYIHNLGIIHMDIKPNNIMVEGGRNVRLMDLGIAYTPGANVGGDSSKAGLMGTPTYAAPEQFNAAHNAIDRRADIYQFGVTLFELITGFNPFKCNSIKEAVDKHRSIILPSSPSISDATLNVLRRAAHPQIQQRYKNVDELRRALIDAMNAPKPKPSGFGNTIKRIFGH